MAQDRKVFVGGVPQDLNQDDLYAIFSEHAGVKKAWLQKCRTTDESGNNTAQQNHRGFGFVIFHDALAIDELLGSAPSRFIVLRNGTKLEVKRALSSNKMSSPQVDGTDPVSRTRAQPPLHMSGPPRALPPGAGRVTSGGRPGVQADWAASRFAQGDLLRQLSLMGNGYLPQAASAPGLAPPLPPYAAAVAPPMMRAPGASPPAGLAPPVAPEGRNVPLRNAIMQFYHEHRPEKLTERDFIDFICSVYEGREAELDEALRNKYGTGLQLPSSMTSVPQSTTSELGLLNPGSFEPSYAWPSTPPMASIDTTRLQQLHQIQFELMNGKGLTQPPAGTPWSDRSLPVDYTASTSCGTGSLSNYSCSLEGAARSALDLDPAKVDPEGPDFSWIDQIVGEDGLEVSDEVAKAIVGKSAAKHRSELLQAVVW